MPSRRAISPARTALAAAAAAAVLAAALALAAPPGALGAERLAPRGFYGASWDGDATAQPLAVQDAQWGRMAAAGVESVRVIVRWAEAQPVAGEPPSFAETDRWMALGAAHGIRLLPVVVFAPRWARKSPAHAGSPPRRAGDYAAFLAALVRRYGSSGSFWRERPDLPRLPVREWVVWNEPHLRDYWRERPWERGYVALLRAAYRAVKRADSRARIVLAGLTSGSWRMLERVYSRAGARRWFDVVALHPYTRRPSGILEIVSRARAVMRRNGDGRKPIWLTEFGWSASRGKVAVEGSIAGIQTNNSGMAMQLGRAYRELVLARRRGDRRSRAGRVGRAYWYTWSSAYGRTHDNPIVKLFSYTGLEEWDGSTFVPKPALAAYRRSARRHQGCAKTEAGTCAARR